MKPSLILGTLLVLVATPSPAREIGELPQKPIPKVKVNFIGQSSFKVSIGQTTTLCAETKPSSRKDKILLPGNPVAAFDVQRATFSLPSCTGTGRELWRARSTGNDCFENASILATINGDQIGFIPGFTITPKSEVAVFKGSGSNFDPGCDSPGLGCFYRDFNVLFKGPPGETLVLAGLNVSEFLGPKQQVGSTPNCPFQLGPTLPKLAGFDPGTSLWGVGDHLEIPAGSASNCADRYTQTVSVEGCQVQTNTLTFAVSGGGVPSITRDDEGLP